MKIMFNGGSIDIKIGSTLQDLLKQKNLALESRIALLVNGNICKKEKAGDIILQENDIVEAVTLAAGG